MRPVRYITAEEERFRVEPLGNTNAVMIKRDPVEPEPVGSIVLMAFRVTGYDKDCDGGLMARLEHIDKKGEGTGWNPTHLGLYPCAGLVVTPPEWAGMFDRSVALRKELNVISAACSEIGTRGETVIIKEAVCRIASELYIDLLADAALTGGEALPQNAAVAPRFVAQDQRFSGRDGDIWVVIDTAVKSESQLLGMMPTRGDAEAVAALLNLRHNKHGDGRYSETRP